MKNITTISYLILAIIIISCQNNKSSETTENTNKVTALYWGDERIFLQDYWGMGASYLMFLPLTLPEGDEGGKYVGQLAKNWEHSDDYRQWTFYLRNNINWHDGVPVTAHDIKFTQNLRMKSVVDSLRPYSINIIDDYSLTFNYKQPRDGVQGYNVYYPKHLLEDLDPEEFYNWDFWKEPVGNGPYKYVRHIPKTMMEVESNPDYFRGEPKIKHVVLKFAEDMSLIELLSGNVDILPFAERDALIKLDGDERFESYYWKGQWMKSIYWNHNNALFENKKIRKALTMAINRKELIQVLNYPKELPIIDAIITPQQLRKNSYPEPIPFNPVKAIQLLEEEGWLLMDGEDVREHNGKKFKFTILTNGQYDQIPLFIQDQFRKIGIQMEIQTIDNSVFRKRAFAGDYEALSSGTALTPHPNKNWNHYKVYGHTSLFGYNNSQMDSLLQIADITIDNKELDMLYDHIAKIFNDEIPITFLFQDVQTHIVNRKLKGLKSPYMANPIYNMEYLWIDEDN